MNEQRYFTVVYKDISAGDEARTLCEHPKAVAMSWSHAMHDRDKALAALARQEPIPFSGADEKPLVFGRRWRLADEGFGLQRDDDGPYVHIDDALSVLHATLAQQEQEAKEKGPIAPTTSPLVGSEPALTAWGSGLDASRIPLQDQEPVPTRDDIIRMAREAHGPITGKWWDMDAAALERFFRAAYAAGAATEREECAKVADDQWQNEPYGHAKFCCSTVAAAIRARGSSPCS